MNPIEHLGTATKAEKDPAVATRMIAVNAVKLGISTGHAADLIGTTQRAVRMWIRRFDEGGIGALREEDEE